MVKKCFPTARVHEKPQTAFAIWGDVIFYSQEIQDECRHHRRHREEERKLRRGAAIQTKRQAAKNRGCRVQVGSDMLFEQIPAYLEYFGLPTTTAEVLRDVAQLSY